MQVLRDQLSRLWSGDTTFVFPSEIAATFWRKEAIRVTGRDSVREDRLISWDVFKERSFGLRGELTPVNKAIRAAFVEHLLLENVRRSFLAAIVAPEYAQASASFADSVTSLLPVLGEFIQVAEQSRSLTIAANLADARAVGRRYCEFLANHRLFEPGWIEPNHHVDRNHNALVLPELIDDVATYESILVHTERISLPAANSGKLIQFNDTRSEIRWVLTEIGDLLDRGSRPDDIMVTVAGAENLVGRIAHEAERVAVPLSFRTGTPLSDTPVGRFLSTFARVVSSGFGVDAFKDLLLNRSVPWIDHEANTDLILQGVALGCLGGRSEPERRWARLRGEAAKKRYRDISRLVRAICGARGFAQLRTSFLVFLSQFVDDDGWADSDQRVLQRCLALIGELVSMEEDLGITVGDPLAFWQDRLRDQLYVEHHRAEGVPVFAYRVAAGTMARHHFIINASQRATSYQISRFPFLTDHQRQDLGPDSGDKDLSAVFLNAYAWSGEAVSFSMSHSTYDGPALAPGCFVSGQSVSQADSRLVGDVTLRDTYQAEIDHEVPGRLFPLQKLGATEYSRVERRVGPDYTRESIKDPEIRTLATASQRSEEHPELLKLSAGDIDAFRACPFSYLLSRGLGVGEVELEIDPDSARDIGTLYHRIFETFFDELRQSEERFSSDRVSHYADALRSIADREFEIGRGMAMDLVLSAYRDRFDRILAAVLEHDASLIQGHRPVSVEGWQRLLLPQEGLLLVGRFDRITQASDGTLTLVDYKKRTLPRVGDLNGGSASPVRWEELSAAERVAQRDAITAIQLPFYVRLLEGAGERVAQAVYYSLESGEQRVVVAEGGTVGKPAMNRDRLDEVLTIIDSITAAIRNRVLAGDFVCPPSCDGCGFRSVCRTRYVVR